MRTPIPETVKLYPRLGRIFLQRGHGLLYKPAAPQRSHMRILIPLLLLLSSVAHADPWNSNSTKSRALGEIMISLDAVPGVSIVPAYGYNEDLDTGVAESICPSCNGVYPGFNATDEEIVEVFSASGADTAAGTGARTVYLAGLDGSLNPVTETLSLDGANPVLSVNKYKRLNDVRVLAAGSTGYNEGALTARQSVTVANVFAIIPISYNKSQIAAYTVPLGHEAYIAYAYTSVYGETDGTINIKIKARPPGGVFYTAMSSTIIRAGTSFLQRAIRFPIGPYPAGTDFLLDATSFSNNMAVVGGFDFILLER